jgi:hypothetical protein
MFYLCRHCELFVHFSFCYLELLGNDLGGPQPVGV